MMIGSVLNTFNENVNLRINSYSEDSDKNSESPEIKSKNDDLSYTKVFDKLDSFFNLGRATDVNLSDLSQTEKEKYMQTLAKLIKSGFMGYEKYEIKGKIVKKDIVANLGNRDLYGAKYNQTVRKFGDFYV